MNPTLVMPPLSALYGAVIRARLAAYSRGLLSATHLEAPVISVGNLTVGGSGKTPLVEETCRILAAEGRRACVLTRGYRRESPNSRVLVSDGKSLHANEKESGDEPFLLAKHLLGLAIVISDPNRAAAGKWAIQEFGVDAFVLDDGFQHLQLGRDLNILVIDASDPWGGNQLLPLGRLREPLSGMKRADCLIITRADECNNVADLRSELEDLIAHRPVLTSRMKPVALKTIAGQTASLKDIPQPIAAFCGVGNPNSFFRIIKSLGIVPVATRPFADHHRYSQNDIDLVVGEARKAGALSLITTAKDAVKLRNLSFLLPCYVQEIRIELEDDSRFLGLLREALREKGQ